MNEIRFAKCSCEVPSPHGFFVTENGALPVQFMSIRAINHFVDKMKQIKAVSWFTGAREAMVGLAVAAGLPEQRDGDILIVDEDIELLVFLAEEDIDEEEIRAILLADAMLNGPPPKGEKPN